MSDWLPQTTPYGSPGESKTEGSEGLQSAAAARDLERNLRRALGKFGAPGELTILPERVLLNHKGVQTTAPLGSWAVDWERLDYSTRERVCHDLARDLTSLRPPSSLPQSPKRVWLIDSRMMVVMGIVAGLFAYAWFSDPFSGSAQGRNGGEPRQNMAAASKITGGTADDTRAARNCATTLSRILHGGNVSAYDAEGWVVEISLLKVGSDQPLENNPALASFVAEPLAKNGSKFIWNKTGELATVDTSDTRVAVTRTSLRNLSGKDVAGLTLRFSGTYVDGYFSEERRGNYGAIAHSLGEALNATHVAVYARCADSQIHTLGSWFRGVDTQSVAAALLYFIGAYAEPPHLATPFVRRPGEKDIDLAYAFANIQEHTRRLDREALATLVGSEGGMALGKDGEGVTVTFPFTDGNRASRVSRTTARVISLNR